VDLTSKTTFVNRPLDISKERGIDRPPLTGDPLSYTQAELSKGGYGLRPKPSDRMYSIWLEAATKPARMLYTRKSDKFVHRTVTKRQGEPWVGSVMISSTPFTSAAARFDVPTLIPTGTPTAASIWPGVGGYGRGGGTYGLMQAGVSLQTTPTTAIYGTWREYCCGNPDNNGPSGYFRPSPGDRILVYVWYCDEKGEENLNGGYGCSHVHDLIPILRLSDRLLPSRVARWT
jgi:hypothetical protein